MKTIRIGCALLAMSLPACDVGDPETGRGSFGPATPAEDDESTATDGDDDGKADGDDDDDDDDGDDDGDGGGSGSDDDDAGSSGDDGGDDDSGTTGDPGGSSDSGDPSTTGDPTGDPTDDSGDPTADPGPITFDTHVWPILSARCGCHGSSSGAGGLSLQSANAYANLVGASSVQSGLDRVAPGDPDSSYLWAKLNDDQGSVGGSGNAMPPSSGLSGTDLSTIETWILEGAVE